MSDQEIWDLQCVAVSLSRARELGLNYSEYDRKFPEGEVYAVLNFKIWEKKSPGLGCYFTADSGGKLLLTAYKSKVGYSARDLLINFQDVRLCGRRYLLKIGRTKNGAPAWLAAERVSGSR